MIYLSGHAHRYCTGHESVGVMMTKRSGYSGDLSQTHWAADTGCYADPKGYSDDSYLAWLNGLGQYRATCLFATAPDVPGNAQATLDLSLPMLPRIRAAGFPAAFIAQDGQEHLITPWKSFDCLFVAGSIKTTWKTSEAAYGLVKEAKRRGKWVHMGRSNSARRLIASHMHGYDSADGTFLAFGPEKNWPRLQGWFDALHRQPTFFRQMEPVMIDVADLEQLIYGILDDVPGDGESDKEWANGCRYGLLKVLSALQEIEPIADAQEESA